jgi:hypothetical protein
MPIDVGGTLTAAFCHLQHLGSPPGGLIYKVARGSLAYILQSARRGKR